MIFKEVTLFFPRRVADVKRKPNIGVVLHVTFSNSAMLLAIIILVVDEKQGNIFMSLKQ